MSFHCPPDGRCSQPNTWKSYNGRCYAVFTSSDTYNKSTATCDAEGAQLAQLTTQGHVDHVVSILAYVMTSVLMPFLVVSCDAMWHWFSIKHTFFRQRQHFSLAVFRFVHRFRYDRPWNSSLAAWQGFWALAVQCWTGSACVFQRSSVIRIFSRF